MIYLIIQSTQSARSLLDVNKWIPPLIKHHLYPNDHLHPATMKLKSKTMRCMPPMTRETLALKLRQNWLAQNPIDTTPSPGTPPLDDSLTSLNWLQNLNIMKIPTPPTSPNSSDKKANAINNQFSSKTQVNPNAILNMTNLPVGRVKQEPGIISAPVCRTLNTVDIAPPHVATSMDRIDYKSNGHIKPPYSYATLICMAMRESSNNKITLAGIYNWITENFMYYRVADPSWQNSIRHNLSLNKCFQKVPRRKDEPGKGGFWRINPEFEDMFVNGIFKKRRCSPVTHHRDPIIAPPPMKRIKQESEDSNGSMASLSGLATATAVQSILTPMNSIDDDYHQSRSVVHIKDEPIITASSIFKQMENQDISETMEFNWSSILNQDIEVGGVRVKTEDILNEADPIASPITNLSPPPSENSSDISLEDLLNTQFGTEMENALDFESGDPLDLTISGTCVRAPQWWEESLNGKQAFMSPSAHSRMSTPVAPDCELDLAHPWAEDKLDSEHAVASFDKDFTNLFDMFENVPCTDS